MSVGAPRMPLALGLGGLAPFIGLTALATLGPDGWQSQSLHMLMVYGALILSFLGGVTWGSALSHERRSSTWLYSMVPFFTGWVALLLPFERGIWLMVLAFAGAWAIDRLTQDELAPPRWFLQLRTLLTGVVVTCLMVTGATTL